MTIRNRCKHVGPGDVCKAGVHVRGLVGGPDFGWGLRKPCLSNNDTEVVCESREFRTPEEERQRQEESRRRFEATVAAVTAIKAKHPARPKRDVSGIIPCPACGGALHYSVSSFNGHCWGKCETEECLSWME